MADTHLAVLLDRFVRRIHMGLSAKALDFDTVGIGPGGAIVLLTVEEAGTIPMAELARRMVRDKSQMTRAVARLERLGMLSRATSEDDQRVTLISVTDAGRAMVRTHQTALAETIDEVMGADDPDTKDQLQKLLLRVLD